MNVRDADFLRARGKPAVGWVLLAAGVIAAVFAMAMDRHWRAGREAAAAAWAQRNDARRAASQAPAKVQTPTLEERRAAAARAELARPWLPALHAIEVATTPPVYLTRMSFERGAGLVRLEADAPSFSDALAYVDRLAGQPSLHGVSLVSHQQAVDAGTGAPSVRFAITAGWGAP